MARYLLWHPNVEEELEILERRRERKTDEIKLKKIASAKDLAFVRQVIESVHIAPKLERYIIELVNETRKNDQVEVGASPRGSLALLKLTRAQATLAGRDFVLPDDVKDLAVPALVHRLILKPDYWLKKEAAYDVIEEILNSLEVPVLENV